MKKSRFFYLHTKTNAGKTSALDSLQVKYTSYLSVCVNAMLASRKFTVLMSARQAFFPACETLSSQIVKNVRAHAVAIVSGWAASKYATTIKFLIRDKFKDGEIDKATSVSLHVFGKSPNREVGGEVSEEALGLYWSWMLDEEIVGRTPTISNRVGMRMSVMTSVLGTSDTLLTPFWFSFSHLGVGNPRIQLPLAGNPHVVDVSDVSKGVLVRKDRRGRWRFEVVEKAEWSAPKITKDTPRIGVDAGLNVMAATSSGRLLGASLKPRFDRLYKKVVRIRSNRQRQMLPRNSGRLDRLESKLTGMVKTMAGACANALVAAHPKAAFVIEDLNLRGCKGAKRFAYRALHNSLSSKAATIVVNPAYSSQMCPSCGSVSRANRSGIKFSCRSCGRKSHADVVGGINLLGRSEDKQIGLNDRPSDVKALLKERYCARRRSSSSSRLLNAPVPSGRRLTTDGSLLDIGTASNRVDVRDDLEHFLGNGEREEFSSRDI